MLLARTESDLLQSKQMLIDAESHLRSVKSAKQLAEAREVVALAENAVAASERLLEQTIGRLALAAARAA
jgi:hypothetical protein